MPDFLLCTIEDTFQVSGRGLIVAPLFPVSEYHFEANQRVRVVSPSGKSLECKAFFQVPHQSPPAKVLSYCCALQEVAKENVPIGSQLWLINREAQ
jgi:hypothetical protein